MVWIYQKKYFLQRQHFFHDPVRAFHHAYKHEHIENGFSQIRQYLYDRRTVRVSKANTATRCKRRKNQARKYNDSPLQTYTEIAFQKALSHKGRGFARKRGKGDGRKRRKQVEFEKARIYRQYHYEWQYDDNQTP